MTANDIAWIFISVVVVLFVLDIAYDLTAAAIRKLRQ